jgi:hypothetical protein
MGVIKRTKLKDYIVRKLGGEQMCVELSSNDLDDAIDDGLRWYSARLGKKKKASFQITAGVMEYDLSTILSADEFDELVSVTKLWLPAGPVDVSFMLNYDFLGLSGVPYESAHISSELTYSGIVQSIQHQEQIKRVLSGDTAFEFDFDTGILLIMPERTQSGTAIFEYKRSIVDGDRLRPREEDFLRKCCIAHAKQTLGRIRSKFDNIPVPGGAVVLDGAQLLDESDKELEILKEEARNFYPLSFFTE